jgi:Family of unknown function (DUF6527)
MNTPIHQIIPQFVEFIPENLVIGYIYISERYSTAIHLCCCSCGEEVVTPLSQGEWRLRRDGDKISLWPSIGNWNFTCRSHYIIRNNRIEWAENMTSAQIRAVQARDIRDKARQIKASNFTKETRAESEHIVEDEFWLTSVLRKLLK